MTVRCAAGFAALLCALQAQSAQWTLGGAAGSRLERVTNPRLTVPAGSPALKLALTAQISVAARTEVLDAGLDASAIDNASNEKALAVSDRNLGLRLARRFERDTLSANAGYRRDSTLASELAQTGIVLTRAQRDNYSFAGTWRRSLTQRLAASGGISASALRYDRSTAVSLIDSTNVAWTAGLSYELGTRTSAQLLASVSEMDTAPFTTRARTTSLQGSLTHAASERLSLSAAYGPSRTRSHSAAAASICPVPQSFCASGLVPFTVIATTIDTVSSGALYSLTAAWQAGLNTSLNASVSRALNPSGAGFLAQSDSYGATVSHRIGEFLTVSADASLVKGIAVNAPIPTRTLSRRFGLEVVWQIARDTFLESGVRRQTGELPGGFAPRSDSLYFGLRYQLSPRAL